MNLVLFAGVSIVVIVTPGPDTALTIRNALTGRRSGLLTALGVGTGQLAWALLTAGGVASVLAAHQGALVVLRMVGGAHLVLLGCHALWVSWRSPTAPRPPRARAGARRAYAEGLVSNLANPKMAVFFLSLIPQFTRLSRPCSPWPGSDPLRDHHGALALGLCCTRPPCPKCLAAQWCSALNGTTDRCGADWSRRPRGRGGRLTVRTASPPRTRGR